jgi:hypothetical protein
MKVDLAGKIKIYPERQLKDLLVFISDFGCELRYCVYTYNVYIAPLTAIAYG